MTNYPILQKPYNRRLIMDMDINQKVLCIDLRSGFYRIRRYPLPDYFGPVDLGLHMTSRHHSLNIGVGLLAGSIFPGSNRLILTGISPCWDNFYISSMGGAGLIFNNLGLNMLSLLDRAPVPSILYLNRNHTEEIEVEIEPVDIKRVWAAGRGGLGSRMLQHHGIAAVIYGGTYPAQDFRDRAVADKWFENKYQKKLAAQDFQATTKYRFNSEMGTGGTFGVNFTTLQGRIIAFNYRSIYLKEEERLAINKRLITDHYLKQFNEETITPKLQKTCGEPCPGICKKMREEYKKDYEPYQTMGPLCGIFDQRAAEKLNHHADRYGFDAISAGGVLAWLMDCLDSGLLAPEELGVSGKPVFSPDGFDPVRDSMRNADLGVELLDSIIERRGALDLSNGARSLARRINSRNTSGFWESERDIDFIHTFLKRKRDVEGDKNPELQKWIEAFDKDKKEAALDFWTEIYKGINDVLREF